MPVIEPSRTVGLGALIGGISVSPVDDVLLTCSGNGVQLWDLEGDLLSTPIMGESASASWSPDGSRIAVTLGNGTCVLLSRDGEVVDRSSLVSGTPSWLGEDPVVISLDQEYRRISVWSFSGGRIGEIDLPERLMGYAWSKNGSLVAVWYVTGTTIEIFETDAWASVTKIDAGAQTYRAAWNPDDSKLACTPSAVGDAEVRIWDMAARSWTADQELRMMPSTVAWSRDGSLVAVVSIDWVRVLDGKTLSPVMALGPISPQVMYLSWTPGTTGLVAGSLDGWIYLWDVSSLSPVPLLEVEESSIRRARISRSGLLALGLASGAVEVYSGWNTAGEITDLVFSTGPSHGGGVVSMEWAHDSDTIAAGYESGRMTLWSSEGVERASWGAHSGRVQDLAWSSAGYVGSMGQDGYLRVWDERGSKIGEKYVVSQQAESLACLAWSPEAERIATGPVDGTVQIWSFPGLELQPSPRRYGPFTSLEWAISGSEEGVDVLSGAGFEDGHILVWDVRGETNLYEELEDHTRTVTDLSWSPDGSLLASSSLDGEVRMWDLVQRQVYGLRSLGGLREAATSPEPLGSVGWTPKGSVVASSNTTLYEWRLPERLSWSIRDHTARIQDIAWSPDSTKVAYTSGSQEIGMYDYEAGVLRRQQVAGMSHIPILLSVAWSGDGTRIAMGDSEGKIRVINTEGEVLLTISDENPVICLEWSPTSQYLAAAGTSPDISIWDPVTGGLVVRLTGHKGLVVGVSWSPDGKHLASGSIDGDLMIWDVAGGELVASHDLGASRISSVCWNPDDSVLAAMVTQAQIGQVLVVVERDGGVVWSRALLSAGNSIGWSANGRWLVVPTRDHQMVFTKWGHHICNLTQPSWADRVEWSPRDILLAAGGYDGVLKIYDLAILYHIPERATTAIVALILTGIMVARITSHAYGTQLVQRTTTSTGGTNSREADNGLGVGRRQWRHWEGVD